ncbi:MAG: hypothetical protein OER80_10235 [Gammaproteobacteria bacterium]|nr:hypothetical protein [Gammaproteobacteria bacterium]
MIYLVQQIILCLLFTALIGAAMGWLLRGLGAARQTEALEARWRSRIAQIKHENSRPPPEDPPETPAASANESLVSDLRRQIKHRDDALEALRTARTVREESDSDSEALRTQLSDTAALCNQLQTHLSEQSLAKDQLQQHMARTIKEKDLLMQQLRERETEIGRIGQERQHAINTIAKLQKNMHTPRDEQLGKTAPDTTSSPEQSISTPATPSTTAPTPTAPGPLLPIPGRQQDLPIAADAPVSSTSDYKPEWLLAAPEGHKDNLQAILGIGPKLEARLNSLGIFHFRQIAQFDRKDILWVARHLHSFPGRIVRDRWIPQAQSLLKET